MLKGWGSFPKYLQQKLIIASATKLKKDVFTLGEKHFNIQLFLGGGAILIVVYFLDIW